MRIASINPNEWEKIKEQIKSIDKSAMRRNRHFLFDEEDYLKLAKNPSLIWMGAFERSSLLGHIIGVSLDDAADEKVLNLKELDSENVGKANTIYIENFCVSPKKQKRGIGKALMQGFTEEAAWQQKFQRLAGHFISPASRHIFTTNRLTVQDKEVFIPNYLYNMGGPAYYCARIINGS